MRARTHIPECLFLTALPFVFGRAIARLARFAFDVVRLVGHAHFACVHWLCILQSSSRRCFVVPHHFCPNVHLAPIIDSRFLRASWLPIPSLSSRALETTTLAAPQETKRWFFQHQTLPMVQRPIGYPIAGSNGPSVAYSSQFLNDHHTHHITNAGFATNVQRSRLCHH